MRTFLIGVVFFFLVLFLVDCGNSSSGNNFQEYAAEEVAATRVSTKLARPTARPSRTLQPTFPAVDTIEEMPKVEETKVPTDNPTSTSVPTAIFTATPLPECWIITDKLNIRSGPSTDYPTIRDPLQDGTVIEPLARNSDATWIKVRTQDTDTTGWISAWEQYTRCNFDRWDLISEMVQPPPTPKLDFVLLNMLDITEPPPPTSLLSGMGARKSDIYSAIISCNEIINNGCGRIYDHFNDNEFNFLLANSRHDICLAWTEFGVIQGENIDVYAQRGEELPVNKSWIGIGGSQCRVVQFQGITKGRYVTRIEYGGTYAKIMIWEVR